MQNQKETPNPRRHLFYVDGVTLVTSQQTLDVTASYHCFSPSLVVLLDVGIASVVFMTVMAMIRTTSIVRNAVVQVTTRTRSRIHSMNATTTALGRPVAAYFFSSDRIYLQSTNTTTSTTSSSSDHNNLPPRSINGKNKNNNNISDTDDNIVFEGVSKEHSDLISYHARQSQTSVSLQALMRTGRGEFLHKTFGETAKDVDDHTATSRVLIQVAGFLRRELPIRLAHRIQDLERVPLMKEMPSVQQVKDLYVKSFLELVHFDQKITVQAQEERFSQLVEQIYERHSKVLVQMARGAFEFRQAVQRGQFGNDLEFEQMQETHDFLDRFYLCRIGIRVLIGQYLALRQPPVDHYVGIICSQTSPYQIVKRAIDDAAFMCTRKYGEAPEVIMSGRLDLTFPYVPTHLHYIMLELLKNSMRATVEWHGIDAMDFPPIKVIIADGADNEDVVIKVSDEGGGISRSNMKKIWSYLFTTADPTIQEGMVGTASQQQQGGGVDHGIDSPLAGLGYGLPISRSYCRYFGGDLSIMSMEGYGTDAFVYLARLGNTKEPLPI